MKIFPWPPECKDISPVWGDTLRAVDSIRFRGAKTGGKHKNAKPLKGFGGAKILEICLDDRNGTYRTMYTVEFEEVVYVLDAFQKKSK
ncbi:MAG: type II toxin-antitoxin system RelE/ParE family toxin [Parachlamydiaceae bacterium]